MSLVGVALILDGGYVLAEHIGSWQGHRCKTLTMFWRGLIVPEISIDPKQAMLHFSYFTWNRNVYPLMYVYLVPDEPSCGMVVTPIDRVKSILRKFLDITVNSYAEM